MRKKHLKITSAAMYFSNSLSLSKHAAKLKNLNRCAYIFKACTKKKTKKN